MRRFAIAALLVSCASISPAGADTLAVVGATLIDGNGGPPLRNATIVADNGRIVAVGPADKIAVPPGARRIGAAGKFVIPGLMDANIHLMLGSSIEYIVRHEGHYEDLIEEAAQI